MPVYNAGKYISEAINSILAQTYNDWELIIVNDGSSDNSEEIILSYAADPRIKYSTNAHNKGLIYTRNRMIEMAEGEYIAFLDSDDISMPDRLRLQVDFLDNNKDYALCGTWGETINANNEVINKIHLPVRDEDIKSSLLFISTFIQSSIMICKQILIENPYDIRYPLAEDYELWCRLSKKYKLKNIPEHLTKYRWHESNISKSKKEHLDSLVKEIYKRELSYMGVEATDEELHIHSAIRDKTIQNISDKDYFRQLGYWLRKIAKAASSSPDYNHNTLVATIAFRWIFACISRKKYFKAASIPVSLNIKSVCSLIRMLRERL